MYRRSPPTEQAQNPAYAPTAPRYDAAQFGCQDPLTVSNTVSSSSGTRLAGSAKAAEAVCMFPICAPSTSAATRKGYTPSMSTGNDATDAPDGNYKDHHTAATTDAKRVYSRHIASLRESHPEKQTGPNGDRRPVVREQRNRLPNPRGPRTMPHHLPPPRHTPTRQPLAERPNRGRVPPPPPKRQEIRHRQDTRHFLHLVIRDVFECTNRQPLHIDDFAVVVDFEFSQRQKQLAKSFGGMHRLIREACCYCPRTHSVWLKPVREADSASSHCARFGDGLQSKPVALPPPAFSLRK